MSKETFDQQCNLLSEIWQADHEKDFILASQKIDAFFKTTDKTRGDSTNPKIKSSDYLKLGRLLRQAFQACSRQLKPALRGQLLQFLDLARDNGILKKIYSENKQEEWFGLLLSLIKQANFTTSQLFQQRCNRYSSKVLFQIIHGHTITDFSWAQVKERVDAISRALLTLIRKNDLSGKVGILSENSLRMACLDLACLSTGIVNVPIATNSVAAQLHYILEHSHIHTLFVSTEALLKQVLSLKSKSGSLQNIILMGHSHDFNDEHLLTWDGFIRMGNETTLEQVRQQAEQVKIEDLATIMYTSGTTEKPKGIMFSQLNIVSKRFARAIALPEIGDHDVFLCYLPLYHTFGRYFEMMGCVFWGSTYVFMESTKAQNMIANMQRVSPTVFISIPKKWMQLYEFITEQVDLLVDPRAEIEKAVDETTGGRLRWGLSAAGYLDPDIFRFFQNYGIELMSGFGMTEATGGITMTPPGRYRDNSVGEALPGIDIRLAEDGEMMLRGPYVMEGYLDDQDPGKKDGWFYTGDVFRRDDDGYYEILDRKKEIYKNVRGETIAPQKIENLFLDFESVQQVFLVGDHQEYNTLLLYPNYEYDQVARVATNQQKLREFFSSLIVSVNRFLAPFERIVNFTIVDRPFQAEKGELTPKGTFKRSTIEKNFSEVIEELYENDYLSFRVGPVEMRIPTSFLREKGVTADEVKFQNSQIVVTPHKLSLTLKLADSHPQDVQIGSFQYRAKNNNVDLSDFLYDPFLWLGNIELVNFVGEEIFTWPQKTVPQDATVQLTCTTVEADDATCSRLQQLADSGIQNLETIHLSAFLIQSADRNSALKAVRYLDNVLATNSKKAKYARLVLLRAADCHDRELKKSAFETLVTHDKEGHLKQVFRPYLDSDASLLDHDLVDKISDQDFSRKQMQNLFELLHDYAEPGLWQNDTATKKPIASLLDLLTHYGIKHPSWYKSIRSELYRWSIFDLDSELRAHARRCSERLLKGFRHWLGPNQHIAVDPETLGEYRWSDVMTFDEDLDSADKDRLKNAIQKSSLVREAIFLFSNGTFVRLEDISHKGVWVSYLDSRHGKSVYRIFIQTRHLGSFDIAVNLNKSLSHKDVHLEITWLVCAGPVDDEEPLVEDFGGYWPDYDLWTEEFIPGETVEKYLRRMDKHTDDESIERMRLLWPYLAWSGLSAYVDFWNRTGRKLEIADPTPANVIVPGHDYQVGFRIVSISERKPFKSLFQMILSLRQHYIVCIETAHAKLKDLTSWHVVFSAFLEILGEKEGVSVLETVLNSKNKEAVPGESEIYTKLSDFIDTVKHKGFLPKRLHFAIQRYRRWYELNPVATPQARLQTIQELINTYALEQLEKHYPGVRIQLFRDTLFMSSDEKLVDALNTLVQYYKRKLVSNQLLLDKLSEMLNQYEVSKEEEFFLTRMTYPHLSASDTAELVSLGTQGYQKTDLVVFLEDREGNDLRIRHPASPKEIARLHRLFLAAKLPVDFQPDHQFLVVVNERQQVIGGLFYRNVDARHVHLDKIVVEAHHRRRGISEGLLKEFFSRLQSQGVKIITVGFLRPEFFYRFGFRIDRSYGNMVKTLDAAPKKEAPDDLVNRI